VCCSASSGKLANNTNELKADKTQREKKKICTDELNDAKPRIVVYIGSATLWVQEKDSIMASYNFEYVQFHQLHCTFVHF
jgi:predicted nucleic acid-binding Zn finger protein